MSDETDIGEKIVSGLEEAVAWKRGEVTLSVIETNDEPDTPDDDCQD